MKVTVIGCGDAFGSGGRSHTCFRIDSSGAGVLVDFGASAIVSWNRLGLDFDAIDAVAISHLHGDHFGGLPFLLLDCQFIERRTRPLALIGPPGLRDRLVSTLDILYPGTTALNWSFPWRVEEIEPGAKIKFGAFGLETFPVVHSAGAPSTGLRVSDGTSIFAYSGDSAWTEALLDISAGVDLFICECSSGDQPIDNHIDWPTLKANLPRFSAKRMAVTHLGPSALARCCEMEQAGLIITRDGQVIDV